MEHKPVRPCEGGEPYIFISYAHANGPAVMQVVQELADRGFRVWYDEGIEVGSEWPEYIAQHLAGASLMIAFLSNAYMRSDNCRREMHFALSRRIGTINIFLEETRLTPGMEMQVGNLFALMKYSMSEDAFYEKLFSAPQLDASLQTGGPVPDKPKKKPEKKVPVDLTVEEKKRKRRKARRIAALSVLGVLLIACVVLGIVGYATGIAQRVKIRTEQTEIIGLPADAEVIFRSAELERAVRAFCGIAEGTLRVSDLASITQLSVGGTGAAFNDEDPVSAAWESGDWTDLSDLRFFQSLVRLTLSELPITDLETLPASGVKYLTIRACPLTSLRGIGKLNDLREIETEGTPIRELGDLDKCLELRRMVLLGANPADLSAVKPLIHLTEAGISNCGIDDLDPLLGLSELTELAFCDCDLRGDFFRAIDREWRVQRLSFTDCKLNSTANLDDFTGLSTLRLIRTGAELDWSALADLPALKTVTVDESVEKTIRSALGDSSAEIRIEEAAA
ncbi:MAG: TIR domain-containing protein [Oscillospiraceae bacterium]|nr:TIR domain-containing protein [Oscillospiraceae bacterium]